LLIVYSYVFPGTISRLLSLWFTVQLVPLLSKFYLCRRRVPQETIAPLGARPAQHTHLFDIGTSPPVTSSMNFGFGSYSMTWKCSSACTDFIAAQFLNQMTCSRDQMISVFALATDECVTYLFRPRCMSKRVVDVGFSLCTRSVCQVASLLILFEGELHPHHEMDDLVVDTVWPIVVEDLEVA